MFRECHCTGMVYNETAMFSQSFSPVWETILIQCFNYTLSSSGKLTWYRARHHTRWPKCNCNSPLTHSLFASHLWGSTISHLSVILYGTAPHSNPYSRHNILVANGISPPPPSFTQHACMRCRGRVFVWECFLLVHTTDRSQTLDESERSIGI